MSTVDDEAYVGILAQVAQKGRPGVGLKVGMLRRFSDLGVLGHVSMGCGTLREVFELWLLFADGAGEPVTFGSKININDGTWSLTIDPHAHLSPKVAELLVNELCAAFFGFAREITGRHFLDFTACLPHGRRSSVDYSIAFPGKVLFGTPVGGVTGPVCVLDLPVIGRRNDEAELMLVQLGWNQDALRRRTPVVAKVQDYLVRCGGQRMTIGGAAQAMGRSERTLARGLAQENSSFGDVLDDFRRAYTIALLRHGSFPPKQIAHIVGFKSENGLRKAFKKWSGTPIGRWSKQMQVAERPQ